ncbi:hypothetical protein MTO96_015992 [Rhipicephalus appendiculatus]
MPKHVTGTSYIAALEPHRAVFDRPCRREGSIGEVDGGVKKTEAALRHGITKSVLTTILKAKLQNNASCFAPDRKRLREAAYPDLEEAVLLLLKRTRR